MAVATNVTAGTITSSPASTPARLVGALQGRGAVGDGHAVAGVLEAGEGRLELAHPGIALLGVGPPPPLAAVQDLLQEAPLALVAHRPGPAQGLLDRLPSSVQGECHVPSSSQFWSGARGIPRAGARPRRSSPRRRRPPPLLLHRLAVAGQDRLGPGHLLRGRGEDLVEDGDLGGVHRPLAVHPQDVVQGGDAAQPLQVAEAPVGPLMACSPAAFAATTMRCTAKCHRCPG